MANHQESAIKLLHELTSSAVKNKSSSEIERQIVEILKKLVDCSAVLIFHHQPEKQQYRAWNPVPFEEIDQKEITLMDDRPIINSLLSREEVFPDQRHNALMYHEDNCCFLEESYSPP